MLSRFNKQRAHIRFEEQYKTSQRERERERERESESESERERESEAGSMSYHIRYVVLTWSYFINLWINFSAYFSDVYFKQSQTLWVNKSLMIHRTNSKIIKCKDR